jgi:hypothetical protein
MLTKRQLIGGPDSIDLDAVLSGLSGEYTSSNSPSKPPSTKVAEVQDSRSEAWEKATRRKVRYGPYRVPPVSEKNMESETMHIRGMTSTLRMKAKKPCETDCTVLSLFSNLEYADGTAAEVSNGVSYQDPDSTSVTSA